MQIGNRLFVAGLSMIVMLYTALVVRRLAGPRGTGDDFSNDSAHGLIPTGDVAYDAREYLRAVQPAPKSASLAELLADQTFTPAASSDHPLVGKMAPDFTLSDDRGEPHRLSELLSTGPVVIVFYYGYHCSHCVAQLFAIHETIGHFRELGAQVVALSADPAATTADRFEQYGRFGFPVVSDAENRVAEIYGVFRRAEAGRDEDLQHGTFLVDREGSVLWANVGPQPFVDNKSLLRILADHSAQQSTTPLDRNSGDKR